MPLSSSRQIPKPLAVESLALFVAPVLVVQVTGVSDGTPAMWASVYPGLLWARVTHAVVYWAGIPYVRTLAFAVGLVATLAFLQVVTAGPGS